MNKTQAQGEITPERAALTNEQMREDMYLRAEEIILLSCIITRRKLAHAFIDLYAHIERLSGSVMPINANYQTDQGPVTPHAAELFIELAIADGLPDAHNTERFNKSMNEMNTYISYLDLLIAKNKPVLHKQEQGQ